MVRILALVGPWHSAILLRHFIAKKTGLERLNFLIMSTELLSVKQHGAQESWLRPVLFSLNYLRNPH